MFGGRYGGNSDYRWGKWDDGGKFLELRELRGVGLAVSCEGVRVACVSGGDV